MPLAQPIINAATSFQLPSSPQKESQFKVSSIIAQLTFYKLYKNVSNNTIIHYLIIQNIYSIIYCQSQVQPFIETSSFKQIIISQEMEIQLKTNQYQFEKQSSKYSPAIADAEGRILLRYESVDVEGQCILLQISPILLVGWRYALFLISNIFLFIPWLLTVWYPHFKQIFYFEYCSLQQATHFYVQNYDQQVSIVLKETKVFMVNENCSKQYCYFINRYMTYIIDEEEVVRVSMYSYRSRIAAMMKSSQTEKGLSEAQAHQLKNTYGPGTMEIQRPSCMELTLREIIRPLYLFLIFSISYWTWNLKYFYFAGTLFFVSGVGLSINLYQMINLNKKIFHMAFYEIPVNVLRSGRVYSISSLEVAPGDIVFLKDPIKIPFEGIILEGSALINECALTGESVPVVKKADSPSRTGDINLAIDKNSFVYEGTTIIQVNDKKKMSKFQTYRQAYGVPVCVVRTNFVTTKGQLIRIILFPKQQENIFQKESSKYLIFLFVLAVSTFIVLVILIHKYVEVEDLVQKFFDLITITVPPSLPVSMTFGIIYAIDRLQTKKIFCIAQSKVITGGMIEFCCFDKTGTLTEDFMDFHTLIPANKGTFSPPINNNEHSITRMLQNESTNPHITDILTNMASNNSIIKIEATEQLIGDPMEIKTFLFGRFILNQSHADPDVIFGFNSERGHKGEVYRRFQFDADLQRMSVVCHISSSNNCQVYAKGSPQMMQTIMTPSSIPKNYQDILKDYASHGFRVLAIASKPVPLSLLKSITRTDAEKQLTFNGFQVFQNKLKPQTRGAIAQLKAAQIGCVMITGDNTLTGSNISYKCNISNRNKGMLICDFINGKFTEENFNFQDDDQTTEISTQKSPPQPNASDDMLLIAKSRAQKYLVEETVINEFTNTERFMDIISQKAESSNCQLCVTGRAFNQLFPGLIVDLTPSQVRFMNNASVFARTKPNDKAKIVMAYQHMDRKVSMCGDGANDCGALKQADIGLSLSQAQASISAPFTSQVANISSMVQLIKQCRAGLATNFALFNIMAIYSLLQYTTTVISEKYLQYPADMQYLYWDLMLNFFFVLFIGYTATVKNLSIQRPRSSLFSFTNLMQMMFAFCTQLTGQIAIIAIYQLVEPDYYYQNGGMDNAIVNYDDNEGFVTKGGLESNMLFVFSNNLYVITMLAFNIAKPWREYFFTNIPLMIAVIITTTYNQMLFLWQDAVWEQFGLSSFPSMNIRWTIFGVSWAFGLFIYINQKVVLQPISAKLVKAYPHLKWL